ncbi:hypothetical protein M427DRAFT_64260 [Gonapodya prolifera JEL478]|uniref:Transmembrane protein n=1 Tax=Gonapodya prolifera (strain JEL478) TaxID=1344416 RepID=A0A138ZXY9_GONPJ|nr:hypothetical protein M427DRAFT_64260 [Gonapodya prolifera JEL478]|eukprot:KXS09366.1 hypothetical protein M427DRAFT_64260 [Gonapodya prolifera JEL478]
MATATRRNPYAYGGNPSAGATVPSYTQYSDQMPMPNNRSLRSRKDDKVEFYVNVAFFVFIIALVAGAWFLIRVME